MTVWTKPSGLEIETNDEPATIAHCESIGWQRKRGRPAGSAPKRAAKPKADKPSSTTSV